MIQVKDPELSGLKILKPYNLIFEIENDPQTKKNQNKF